jgi:23S rRNA (adenine-N6)-dimethyltransferase
MDKRHRKRKLLGQNFLRSRWLAAKLVGLSSVCAEDVVYEIGPGRGILTVELARRAKKVVAIECDSSLARHLRRRFSSVQNVHIVECDYLNYRLPERNGTFKIVSNVPYGSTAKLMRKLLNDQPLAAEIVLLLQREAALKYSGIAGETLVSLLVKPRFKSEIAYRLRRTDFEPAPNVDSVLLIVTRRQQPFEFPTQDWKAFVRTGFCSWRTNLRLALKRHFSYRTWKRLARELDFPINAKPSELCFEQWQALYRQLIEKRTRTSAVSAKCREYKFKSG